MISKTIKNKNQSIIIWTVVVLLSFNPIVSFINTLTNLYVGEGFIYDTVLLYSIILIMLVTSTYLIFNRLKSDVLITFYIILFILILTVLIKPQNFELVFTNWDDFMSNPFYYFFFTFIGYALSRHICDNDLFVSIMIKTSIFIVICSIANYIILLNQGIIAEYMVISYDALLFVVFLLVMSFKKNTFLLGLLGLTGSVFIFIAGSRGALISLIFTLFIYFIFKRYSKTKKIILSLILILTIFLFSQYFEEILVFLGNRLGVIGLDSRTINAFLGESFLNYSDRGEIQKVLINNFTVFGAGIFGDRLSGGGYAHNIFIEILFQWGILIGPLLIIAILTLISRSLINRKNKLQIIVIVFLSTGFFKLLFSGSYLTEVNFGVLMALCVNSLQRTKPIQEEINFSNKTNENTLAHKCNNSSN